MTNAKKKMPTIGLRVPVRVVLEEGPAYVIWPLGGGGIGICITEAEGGQPKRGKGRPASPSTLELRECLAEDLDNSRVRDFQDYVDWFREKADTSRASAYQTVRREYIRIVGRRPDGGGGGRRSHVRDMLRKKMQADLDGGHAMDANHYVRWLVAAAGIGLKQAKTIVQHEELRRAKWVR